MTTFLRVLPAPRLRARWLPLSKAASGAQAQGVVPLPSFGAAGTAKAIVQASGAIPFPAFGASGQAVVPAKASGAIPFPAFGASGIASTGAANAQGVVPFPALGCTGTAKAVSSASGAIPFAPFSCSGAAKAIIKATGAIPFPGFGASGQAKVQAKAQGVIPFPSFGAVGSAGDELPEAVVSTHYAAQIAMVLRILTKKGITCTLRHYPETGPTTRNRVRGSVSDDGHTDHVVTVVLFPVKKSKGKGGMVLSHSRELYIAGATCTVDPREGDKILGLEGRNWTIQAPGERLGPDGVAPILYVCQIGK